MQGRKAMGNADEGCRINGTGNLDVDRLYHDSYEDSQGFEYSRPFRLTWLDSNSWIFCSFLGKALLNTCSAFRLMFRFDKATMVNSHTKLRQGQ